MEASQQGIRAEEEENSTNGRGSGQCFPSKMRCDKFPWFLGRAHCHVMYIWHMSCFEMEEHNNGVCAICLPLAPHQTGSLG